MFGYSLDGKGPPEVHFELTPYELASIGVVVVQWAAMEHALFDRTRELCRRAKIRLPRAAYDNSFARRLRAFRSVVETTTKLKEERDAYLGLHAKITTLNADRDRIVHGVWEYDPARPTTLFNFSLRPPHHKGRVTWYTMQSIGQLSERIGAITYALGVSSQGMMKKGVQPFASMSRRFLLMSSGIPPEEMGYPEYIHAEPLPLRSIVERSQKSAKDPKRESGK
jgi:hypothetical protein